MANMTLVKTPMPEQDPQVRARNFKEVALGYTAEMAIEEANRCLGCKNPKCVEGCPVNVRIPEFIKKVQEGDFKAASDNLYLMTDDGSYGEQGFVTVKLQQLLESGKQYDEVLAIGPIPMMKFVCKTTEPFGVKTMVSLNPIMVDGTGMCGGCRVTVGGEVKFACVDGPEFDGHQVDFAELMSRNSTYRTREAEVTESHACRMDAMGKALIK